MSSGTVEKGTVGVSGFAKPIPPVTYYYWVDEVGAFLIDEEDNFLVSTSPM